MANFPGDASHNSYTGTNSSDVMMGRGGNDTLKGLDGVDYIYGGTGNDHIYGGRGPDVMYGDEGDDIFYVDDVFDNTTAIGDRIDGGDGVDIIAAVSSDGVGYSVKIRLGDVSGVEILYNTTASQDLLVEGSGVINLSRIQYYETEGGSLGQVWGGSANDTISGYNFSTHEDTIYAGAGNDVIYGFAGDDALMGGVGNDTISGGAGNDRLYGDGGADVFRFNVDADEGVDRLRDYADGVDRIQINGAGGSLTFDDLEIVNSATGCDVSVNGKLIFTVENVDASALDAGDFLFS